VRISGTGGEVRCWKVSIILKFHKDGEKPVVKVRCTEGDGLNLRTVIEDKTVSALRSNMPRGFFRPSRDFMAGAAPMREPVWGLPSAGRLLSGMGAASPLKVVRGWVLLLSSSFLENLVHVSALLEIHFLLEMRKHE